MHEQRARLSLSGDFCSSWREERNRWWRVPSEVRTKNLWCWCAARYQPGIIARDITRTLTNVHERMPTLCRFITPVNEIRRQSPSADIFEITSASVSHFASIIFPVEMIYFFACSFFPFSHREAKRARKRAAAAGKLGRGVVLPSPCEFVK